jgi:hypothetical protein
MFPLAKQHGCYQLLCTLSVQCPLSCSNTCEQLHPVVMQYQPHSYQPGLANCNVQPSQPAAHLMRSQLCSRRTHTRDLHPTCDTHILFCAQSKSTVNQRDATLNADMDDGMRCACSKKQWNRCCRLMFGQSSAQAVGIWCECSVPHSTLCKAPGCCRPEAPGNGHRSCRESRH